MQYFFLFRLRTETTEHFDPHGVIEHALSKDLEVLLGENGGRRKDCDLFAVHDRFECSADRDFGFAKADIAANQAVHRLRSFHVDLGVDDRFHLIRRFAERERMLKLGLPFGVGRKRMAGMHLAFGLQHEHFAGVIEDGGRSVFLGANPPCIAKRAKRRRFFSNTDIARDEIGLLERNVEFGFIGELDREHLAIFMVRSVGLRRASFGSAQDRLGSRPAKFLQPEESSDAVLEMHHEIAFGEFAEINLGTMAVRASQLSTAMCGQPSE